MARKQTKIKTVSYVEIDGELREVQSLPPEVWEPIRRRLVCRYLNELFRGEAHFYYDDEEGETEHDGVSEGIPGRMAGGGGEPQGACEPWGCDSVVDG